jgi:hypothetical protein
MTHPMAMVILSCSKSSYLALSDDDDDEEKKVLDIIESRIGAVSFVYFVLHVYAPPLALSPAMGLASAGTAGGIRHDGRLYLGVVVCHSV